MRPVLDPYQRDGQFVGPDNPLGYHLRRVSDGSSRIVGEFRTDHHWSVAHVVWKIDPYTAVRGTSPDIFVGVDVVAG